MDFSPCPDAVAAAKASGGRFPLASVLMRLTGDKWQGGDAAGHGDRPARILSPRDSFRHAGQVQDSQTGRYPR